METLTTPEKSRAKPRKHILPRQVHAFHGRVFVVKKDPRKAFEQDLVLDFGHEVRHRVIKLSTQGFPKENAHGKPITWISNFGVIDAKRRYVDGVKYTLILPALPDNQVYVNYENGEVKDLVPVPTQQLTQVVLVELTTGDPPIGIRPKGADEPVIG